jgi:hypothetical protein
MILYNRDLLIKIETFNMSIDGYLNQMSNEDENYDKIEEIRKDNIEAENRQLKSRKKLIAGETDSNR